MLDFIYHMTLKLLLILISAVKTLYLCNYIQQRSYGRHNVSRKSTRGDQKVRGKVLLNRIASIDCNEMLTEIEI